MARGETCRCLLIKAEYRAAEHESRTTLQLDDRAARFTILEHLKIGAVRLEAAVGSADICWAIDGHSHLARDHRTRLIVSMKRTLDEFHNRRFRAACWVILNQYRRDAPSIGVKRRHAALLEYTLLKSNAGSAPDGYRCNY